MPKVTLLGKIGSSYTIIIIGGSYTFTVGKAVEVPVAVALEAQKKLNRRKGPLFLVEDLPNIVTMSSAKMIAEETLVPQQKDTNGPRQLRLGAWA